ncbi:NADP-dependent oxidoreductase [Facklamia sp. 7083-14-GEN3]|uniref:NADP-dependent oxidoreductase n=1 Tax=Facklamia sp. 7083-14-GEN3 TaxID=2973478 RepID=UPI00215CC4BA|nr:NADP-dependent oxidoreductase [Facklamia sp. 7083-14-GEN3]MCR8969055.1 NADP-dependent oxidoreductase [Facklamia sp. 7083-14-GEN3]
MKAIVINQYGDTDQFVETQVPKPQLKDNQVLIELHATSINRFDTKVRRGEMAKVISFDFPIILGLDAAGVIVEVGKDVTQFKVGDEVFANSSLKSGTYTEYVAVKESLVVAKPQNIDFKQAAAVPMVGLTAWQAMAEFGQVKEGDRVLIHAGSGGVGSFAIQIAKSFGAYVYSTASGKNEDMLKELGVDEFINYKTTDFADVAKDLDLVLDTLGGETLVKSLDLVKDGGRLVSTVGQPDEEKAKERGITVESLSAKSNGDHLDKLADLIEKGQVTPYVGHEFPLTAQGLRQAHDISESHHAKGKIVIKIK